MWRNVNFRFAVAGLILSAAWYGLLLLSELCALFLRPTADGGSYGFYAWYNVPVFLLITVICLELYFYSSFYLLKRWFFYIPYAFIWPAIGAVMYILVLSAMQTGVGSVVEDATVDWVKFITGMAQYIYQSSPWQVPLGVFMVLIAFMAIKVSAHKQQQLHDTQEDML